MIPGLNTLAAKALGMVALLAPAFAGVQTVRLSNALDDLEDARNKTARCEAQHAVTRQSVSMLEAVIDDLNERALARGEAYAAAKVEAAKAETKLDALAVQSDRQIEALRRAAREQYNGDCPVPETVRDLARGL
jgi:outer membrane murein-binding lipoprotein Lpp